MIISEPKQTLETNCRLASPLDARRQFGRAVHAQVCISGGRCRVTAAGLPLSFGVSSELPDLSCVYEGDGLLLKVMAC